MTTVAVVDYGMGNLKSVSQAVMKAAEGSGVKVVITQHAEHVFGADRIVLPGQGAFADCAAGLAAVPGLRQAVDHVVQAGRPFLGICVGMQLLAERGLEHRVTAGFGWISGEIARLEAPGLRLPQMGWNDLSFKPGSHPLLEGLHAAEDFYFVHSYGLRGYDEAQVLATTDYGGRVPALVASGNRAGTQFHVEKSQEAGLRILANFLRWSP